MVEPVNTVRVIVWVVASLFALLNMFGATYRLREKQFRAPCAVMDLGAAMLLAAVAASAGGLRWDWLAALAGCALICVGAYWNGVRCGVIHAKHHAVRISFCLLLLMGFYLY